MAGQVTYPLRPLEHGLSSANVPLYLPQGYSPMTINCRFHEKALKRRAGTTLYRSVGRPVYGVYLYQKTDGSRYTLILTDTDLIKVEDSGTWSYLTQTYATGTITTVSNSGTDAVLTGNLTAWNTSGVAAGDRFIIDSDHGSTSEPDVDWATVKSVDSATSITLSGHYAHVASTGTYKIRKVYSVPSNERWWTTVVGGKFCFGNGNIPVQYWEGTGYATDLNATYALHARCGMEYANRLFLADVDVSGLRSGITVRWSKENDCTDWTDTTAGEMDLMETGDFITGLAGVGDNLLILMSSNFYVYTRTGTATDPITKVVARYGVGCPSPYSIVNFEGACAFVGQNDFYMIQSDTAIPFGDPVRHFFFDIVGVTELRRVIGGANQTSSELYWITNTTLGKYIFMYSYKLNEWILLQFPTDTTAFGIGAL